MMGLPPYSWGAPGTFWYAHRYFLISGHVGSDHRIIFPFDDIIDIDWDLQDPTIPRWNDRQK